MGIWKGWNGSGQLLEEATLEEGKLVSKIINKTYIPFSSLTPVIKYSK